MMSKNQEQSGNALEHLNAQVYFYSCRAAAATVAANSRVSTLGFKKKKSAIYV